MKVQMVIRISGTRNGVDWPAPGGVVEVGDAEGARLVAAGFARPVEAKKVEPVVEKAVAPKVETAARKGGLTKGNTGI